VNSSSPQGTGGGSSPWRKFIRQSNPPKSSHQIVLWKIAAQSSPESSSRRCDGPSISARFLCGLPGGISDTPCAQRKRTMGLIWLSSHISPKEIDLRW
jgi:hypothetical protein